MKNEYPVASIGSVNLKTGRNLLFETIWDCWEEADRPDNQQANILVQDVNYPDRYYVCHTSGSPENTAKWATPGLNIQLIGDQTRRRIGGYDGWRVIKVFPHTKLGLTEINLICRKTSLVFACFK